MIYQIAGDWLLKALNMLANFWQTGRELVDRWTYTVYYTVHFIHE